MDSLPLSRLVKRCSLWCSEWLEEERGSETVRMLGAAIQVYNLLMEELRDDQPGAEQQLAWARSYTSSFTSGRLEVLSLLLEELKDDQPGAEQQLAWARSYTSSIR